MDCCASAAPTAGPIIAQVLGIGLVWTTLHCAGMCGPLVASLRLGQRGCVMSATTAAGDSAAYQSGRAVTLALLGAAAGLIGQTALAVVQRGSLIMGFAIGIGFLVYASWRLLAPRASVTAGPGLVARCAGRVARAVPGRPRLGAFLLGMTLGLMPCMIVAWALSLAAASASPWVGAAAMLCLVGITAPVLTAAALAPALVGRLRRSCAPWVAPASMLVSAAWMLLITSASAGWIAHRSILVGGHPIMFW